MTWREALANPFESESSSGGSAIPCTGGTAGSREHCAVTGAFSRRASGPDEANTVWPESPYRGLQIGDLGQELDIQTFMAELMCDPSYVRVE